MVQVFRVAASGLVAMAMAVSAQGQTVAPRPSASGGVDAVFARWSGKTTPGCAVSVAKAGRTVLARAFGSADLEHDVPLTTGTVFESGSLAKQFTAAAILLLVQDGRLKLGDDVRRFVPELPDYGDLITVEHLLTHTNGLRDWGAVAAIGGWPRTTRVYAQTDVLDIAARQRHLNYRPGTEYLYANTGYNLLAMIVERVSGKSFQAFSSERLFTPLGMASTRWRDDFRRVVKGRAIAYERRGDAYAQLMPFEDVVGNGGLLTTLADLQAWNAALDSARLGPFVTTELQRPGRLSDGRPIVYARGLFVGKYRGVSEISHAGATAGYRAWLGRYPQHQLSVAVLCNTAEANATELARRVADLYLPAAASSGHTTIAATPRQITSRTGLYVNERTGAPILLTAVGERLRVSGGPELDWAAENRARFGADELEFDGPDQFQRHTFEGDRVRYRRVQPAKWRDADLKQFTGVYVSAEADVTFVVSLEGGRLRVRPKGRAAVVQTLTPSYGDAFLMDDSLVRFYRDARGRVVELGVGTPRVRDLRFARAAG
jgi:CubicO group peptidase (beta-lactamase class C family)